MSIGIPKDALIGSIDQGTSSTRFSIYDCATGNLKASSSVQSKFIYPQEGWVEQDANVILKNVQRAIDDTLEKLRASGVDPSNIKGIGIANQRETIVLWDKNTGEPFYNAVIWMDNRAREYVEEFIESVPKRDLNHFKSITGLPISTYFSAFKLHWLLKNVPHISSAMSDGRLLFGTIDSWLLWKLTGNHCTDVTNASRTFLFDINSLTWSDELCKRFRVSKNILPKVHPSSYNFGVILSGSLKDIPIVGILGDQSASLIGHNCLKIGEVKATYGTGCFLLQNLGCDSLEKVRETLSKDAFDSLITTIAYQIEGRVYYALEASIQVAGAAINWLQSNLQFWDEISELEKFATSVTSSHGLYFVPAFQGLYAPYWDPSATGLLIGITQFTNKSHIIRAVFDSIAFQTADILSLMKPMFGLRVDGGLVSNDLICQTLADVVGIKIYRPSTFEITSFGAALTAGHTLKFWSIFDTDSDSKVQALIKAQHLCTDSVNGGSQGLNIETFKSEIDSQERSQRREKWRKAVERCMKWNVTKTATKKHFPYESAFPLGMFVLSFLVMVSLSKILN